MWDQNCGVQPADRQTYRLTDRQTHRKTHRHTDTQTHRHTDTQADRHGKPGELGPLGWPGGGRFIDPTSKTSGGTGPEEAQDRLFLQYPITVYT